MNFKIRYQGLFFGAAFLLVGCFGDGGSDYPPLKKSQLVGCWERLHPASNISCFEQCFSKNDAVYLKSIDPNLSDGSQYFVEWTGSYSLLGNVDLNLKLASKNNQGKNFPQEELKVSYTILRDTLNDISPNGTLDPYVRRDTTHNCGPHWMLFPKPADWELP